MLDLAPFGYGPQDVRRVLLLALFGLAIHMIYVRLPS